MLQGSIRRPLLFVIYRNDLAVDLDISDFVLFSVNVNSYKKYVE